MNSEQVEIQLEFLENLEKTVFSLEKQVNSIERQRALYHLRALCLLRKSAVVSEIGDTSLLEETNRTRLRILRTLSNLGTESLLGSSGREENINV